MVLNAATLSARNVSLSTVVAPNVWLSNPNISLKVSDCVKSIVVPIVEHVITTFELQNLL